MARCGYTAAGTQRWKCKNCKKVICRKRNDVGERNRIRLVERWLTGTESLPQIAKRIGKHRTTLSKKFSKLFNKIKSVPLSLSTDSNVLVLDGTTISKGKIALIVYDRISKQPLAWSFVEREYFESWYILLEKVRRKNYSTTIAIVSDGQKGLRKAVSAVFPGIMHQRCIIHIIRLSLSWLTKNPKTDAGIELRKLVCVIGKIKTNQEAKLWEKYFEEWDEKYSLFLKEKSINPATGRKWHTHRKLRGVRSLIKTAIPNMFLYSRDARIPNTTNCVEGGINSRIAELLHRHRGINEKQKIALVRSFLYLKRKTSTRNAT